MPESISLVRMLESLSQEARQRGLNDSQWAAAAGVRKETLSRIRSRGSCDFATLSALAGAAGAGLAVVPERAFETTPDGHMPARLDRAYEERLARLCLSGDLEPPSWRAAGPAFFMAGLAVMLAGTDGFDRRRYLALAERLHPGSSRSEVYAIWLAASFLRPSRFVPLLRARMRHAA